MKNDFVGRSIEKQILLDALQSNEAELVAVVGRRRVGKTFLVRSVYADAIQFEMIGIQKGTLQEQLEHFSNQFNIYFKPSVPYPVPKNWLHAFQMLILHFLDKKTDHKIVLFFDEFPWIATRRSGFLKAFGVFWNTWASQNNVVVVICGSAASWMIQKVVRDRGGLHNRITRRIQLEPFNLAETQAYFENRSINLDLYQIIQIYMALGGIPHYLKEVKAGQSAVQNIDRIFFSSSSIMKEEFDLLYPSLFENPENHIEIIRTLAEKWQGLTRSELTHATTISNGGTLSKTLEELVHSGFLMPFYTFGKNKRGIRYRLMDEYSIFYLKFIEDKRIEGKGTWERLSQTQTYKTWSGYAFENICLRHISQIKKALGIAGVYSETSTYRKKGDDENAGVQIDMLIDRKDHVINLCELKFYNTEFSVSKAYAQELRKRMQRFKEHTQTKKQLFWTLVTTYGLEKNQHSIGLVDRVITMDALFHEEDNWW